MKIVVILIVILILSGISYAQDETPAFEIQNNPIVLHGTGTDWDSRNTAPGAVIYHDGQFHMFRTGIRGWLQPAGIGYLISDDGITWEEVQEDPVFTQEQLPFEVGTAFVTAALVEDDGTWVFYFTLFHADDSDAPPVSCVSSLIRQQVHGRLMRISFWKQAVKGHGTIMSSLCHL